VYLLGIIPARGGSKGVKDKNIIEINGKPLIGYTIESALSSRFLSKTVASTDSAKIAGVVNDISGIEVIKRPPELARDNSPIEEALFHAVQHVESKEAVLVDIAVWMQPNVPIRREGIIDEVVEKLMNSDADSCVTCYEADQIPELMKIINEKNRLVPLHHDVNAIRRQEFPNRYLLDGSVVAFRRKNLFQAAGTRLAHGYLGEEVIPVIQYDRKYSMEIDVPDDLDLVRYYMQKKTV
jgi:CMP-N,N'-diacetyllegionaminic acid synthase